MDEAIYQLVYRVTYSVLKPLLTFLHRDSYLYWPFIASTLLIGMLAWRFTSARGDLGRDKSNWKEFFNRYCSKKLWWHPSSRLDYRYYFINGILFPLLVGPLLFSDLGVAELMDRFFGTRGTPSGNPRFTVTLLYTVCFFIAYDFGRFVAHSMLHDIPMLWRFHRVHHSAEVLTPFTAFRVHPLDAALMAWIPAITTGMVTWLFHELTNGSVSLITFLGTHAILWISNLVGNLRHWHIWISYGPTLNRWLISPAHHHLHHSCETRHLGCNRGFELAIWDRLYGTLYIPPQIPEKFRIGLDDGSDGAWRSVWQLYWKPFQDTKSAPSSVVKDPASARDR